MKERRSRQKDELNEGISLSPSFNLSHSLSNPSLSLFTRFSTSNISIAAQEEWVGARPPSSSAGLLLCSLERESWGACVRRAWMTDTDWPACLGRECERGGAGQNWSRGQWVKRHRCSAREHRHTDERRQPGHGLASSLSTRLSFQTSQKRTDQQEV